MKVLAAIMILLIIVVSRLLAKVEVTELTAFKTISMRIRGAKTE
jgi:hypothetical protein